MKQWLIDLGNTRIKSAWRDSARGEQGEMPAITHRDSDWPERLAQNCEHMDQPEVIWISSVAHPIMTGALLERIRNRYPEVPVNMAETRAESHGIRIAYRQPEKFGVDRFLALIAAHRDQACNQVVIGCGTALTIDALHADGRHEGGVIVAAPILMRSALMAEAGRIHLQREGRVVDFAVNTDDAMMSGSILAAAALIERSLARFQALAGAAPRVLAHGGGWWAVAPQVNAEVQMVADLPLRGLAMLADE